MSKRAIDDTEDRATKQVRTTLEQPTKAKADDEGMGEFEDQWGDEEESDGEIVEHDAEAEEENGDEDSEDLVTCILLRLSGLTDLIGL
jgi:ribosome assembly protein RRB1